MPEKKKATVTPLRPKASPSKPAPARRRLVVDLDPELYAALEALALDQRREFKPQMVILLENAVKMHQGQKRSKARKAAWERRLYGDGEQ